MVRRSTRSDEESLERDERTVRWLQDHSRCRNREGRFAEYLNNSGFDVVGIDVSLSMMAKAREKGVRNLVQADAHYLPFRDMVFDGAILVHVLHLVRDWVRVVDEVGQVTSSVVVAEVEE